MSESSLPPTVSAEDCLALLQSIPGANLILDLDLVIVAASDEYLSVTMTTRRQLIGRPLFEVFPDNPEDPQADGARNLRASLDLVRESGRRHTMAVQRYDIRPPSGDFEVRFWDPTNVPVVDDVGRMRFIIHHVRDVTSQHRLHAALVRRDLDSVARTSLLDVIAEASPDPMKVIDRDLVITEANHAVVEMLGVPARERLGHSVLDVVHPDDLEHADIELRRLVDLRTDQVVTLRYRIRHADGHYVAVEARGRSLRDTSGEPIGAVLNERDITATVEAETALTRSVATIQGILDSAIDTIAILDQDLTIVSVNHEITDLTGHEVEEVQGVTAFQNVHPDDRTTVLAVFRDLFANGSTVNVRYRNRHVDGRWVTVEVRARPLHRTEGDLRAVLVARDVTENVILENALRSAKAEAERANRAKSEFLSRMSHELRTPLNSVLGFTQVLQREEHLAEQEESLDYIYRAGLHLLDLINEVLDISRIESGTMSVSLESVAIEDLTHDCLALVAPQAQANDVRLVHRRDGAHYVRTDQQRATQVILNLLSNAIKYNRRDGSVTVTYEERSEWLRLSVTDTGNGIRPEDFTSLFEPFERLEAEFGNVEGTGLGLALSKGLVEAMGGELGMTSTLGEGSTFWVEFPIVTAPILDLDDTQTPMAVQGGGTGSSTLLYVEDNFANLKLVERLLRHRHDVRLLSATKGTLGFELAQQHLPQLILLDIHLPDVSGHDLLKRLRADPRTATIPVVIVSADATAGQLRRLMSAGAQDYLTKPLKVSAFFDVVNRFLKHQGPQNERPADE